MPFDRKAMIWPGRKRAVKMGFTDVTPGANRIGKDVELYHSVQCFAASRVVCKFFCGWELRLQGVPEGAVFRPF